MCDKNCFIKTIFKVLNFKSFPFIRNEVILMYLILIYFNVFKYMLCDYFNIHAKVHFFTETYFQYC